MDNPSKERITAVGAAVTKGKIEQILAGIRDDFVMYDHEWRYVYVNDRAAQTLGYSKEQLIGQCIWDLFPEAVGNLFYQKMHRAMAEKREVVFEHYYEPFDRWFENRAYPVEDGLLLFATDITERKRTEEALRASEQRFTRFMQKLPGLAWIKDIEGRYVYVNDTAEKAFRKTRAELYGRTDDEIFPPQVAARFRENDRQAIASETGILTVETLEHEDGILHYSIVSKFPITGADGKISMVGGVAIDITKRKRAEEELKASEERERARAEELQALMEAVPAVIWIARDAECRVITGSHAAHDLLRMPMGSNLSKTAPEDARPTHFRVFKDSRELAPHELPVQLAACGIEIHDFEEEVVFEDGVRLHLYGNAVPLRDREGKVRGAISAFVDITERKRVEEALKEADRRKDEFLAMLAHELRNPLAPILNAVQLLGRLGPAEPQLVWSRDIIERQVGHLARLVDDLLDVSRITQGKIVLQKERIELMTVIARAIETSRPMIEMRKHHLSVSLPQNPVQIEGDATRLAQVVSNLLNNAAKYTEEGGHIRLTAEEEKGGLVLRVSDTGMGIPVDFLPHVFDLFTQADRSLDRSQGGLGIGLTLVRSIVEMHGGQIEAFSRGPGQGSEFVVRLPLVTEPQQAVVFSPPSEQGVRKTACYRILVVDDNVDSAESMMLLLRLSGHDVRMAHDGPATLELARSFNPEVILLDIGLPEIDGFEVARRLRNEMQMKDATLIALTGYGQAEDRRRSKEAGFDFHMVKPVNPDALQALIVSLGHPGRDGQD